MNTLAQRPLSARWLYAVKPASWPKLLMPLVLGQLIGAAAASDGVRLDPRALLVGGLFTVSGLLFIVLLNDWGDREVDRIKRAMFPDGCSPKTIPDAILPGRALLHAGLFAGAIALLAAWLGAPWLERPLLGWAGLCGMLVFCAYTLPPLRLNYRGGGELLEMLGVGLLLPWFNAYAQSGALLPPTLWVLPGFSLLALASALASTLADEESDRAGGKTTSATRFGNGPTRAAIDALVPLAALTWLACAHAAGGLVTLAAASPAVAITLFHYREQRAGSAAAVTNAFPQLAAYKTHLHRAIGRSALCIGLSLPLLASLPGGAP